MPANNGRRQLLVISANNQCDSEFMRVSIELHSKHKYNKWKMQTQQSTLRYVTFKTENDEMAKIDELGK